MGILDFWYHRSSFTREILLKFKRAKNPLIPLKTYPKNHIFFVLLSVFDRRQQTTQSKHCFSWIRSLINTVPNEK
ncbi:MAG: hypothetical protein ACI85O_001486 [Saprospiraceae bacterium]|jgi:hypothetical protein